MGKKQRIKESWKKKESLQLKLNYKVLKRK